MEEFGVYFQVYRKNKKTELSLKSLRRFYKDNPVYLISDNGDDFFEYESLYNCKCEHSPVNLGVKPSGYTKLEAIEFLGRFKRCCLYCNTKYLLYLEDDNIIRNRFIIDSNCAIMGVTQDNVIPDVIIDHVLTKYQGCKFNVRRYGACGGTIYNVDVFLSLYDSMVSFIHNEFDFIHDNISNKLSYLDCLMPFLFMLNGHEYYLNQNVVETTRNPYWKSSGHAIIHVQDDDLLDKIINGEVSYE